MGLVVGGEGGSDETDNDFARRVAGSFEEINSTFIVWFGWRTLYFSKSLSDIIVLANKEIGKGKGAVVLHGGPRFGFTTYTSPGPILVQESSSRYLTPCARVTPRGGPLARCLHARARAPVREGEGSRRP